MCVVTGVPCTLEAGLEVKLPWNFETHKYVINYCVDHQKDHPIPARHLLWRGMFHNHRDMRHTFNTPTTTVLLDEWDTFITPTTTIL